MNTDTLSIHSPLNDFVKTRPDLMPALQKLDFDICCGGHKTLSEACSEKKLDANAVLSQLLTGETANLPVADKDWSAVSLTELTDHLEKTHHVYLREVEPRLYSLLKKVIAAHGQNHPELHQLENLVKEFWNDMTPHLMKEERVLFPMIREMDVNESLEGPSGFIQGPIKVMRHEHEAVTRILVAMNTLTREYTLPSDACATYGALMKELKGLETDTYLHLHKENEILFPRALESC